MAYRELPVISPTPPQRGNGHRGAAVSRTRDAYRDIPILQRPPWGHWIAGYFFFGGISSGSFVVAALADLSGGQRARAIAHTAHYVALASLLPCPPFLIADLGKPARFHHMLRVVKPSSPMNLGAWVLTVHGAATTAGAAVALARDGRVPLVGRAVARIPISAIGAGGLPSALALGGYTGVLLGTSAIPVWYTSPLLGALFMASAISTGVAAVSLVGAMGGNTGEGDHDILAPFALIASVTEAALLGGYLATSGRAAAPLLRGTLGAQLGGAAICIVAATALDIVATRAPGRRQLLTAVAAGATLIGGALLRWSIVHAGHASADDREGTLAASSPSRTAPGWGP